MPAWLTRSAPRKGRFTEDFLKKLEQLIISLYRLITTVSIMVCCAVILVSQQCAALYGPCCTARMPSVYCAAIANVQNVVPKEFVKEVNYSIAFFLRDLLTLVDRGRAFRIIRSAFMQVSPSPCHRILFLSLSLIL